MTQRFHWLLFVIAKKRKKQRKLAIKNLISIKRQMSERVVV